jgi:signal transduction histidine kinase
MSDHAESISRLLHDLNNDLGVIVGHVDLALRKADKLPEPMARRLESIKRAAERMNGSIKKAQSSAREMRSAAV